MATTAIRGRGPAYDVRPIEASAWAPLAKTFNFGRNVGQGACAGLLTYIGALRLSGSLGPEALGAIQANLPAAMQTLAGSLAASGLALPVEFIAAAVLFFSAGRGLARVLGLMGFVAFVAAYASGVGKDEMLDLLISGFNAIEAFIAKFQAA